MLIASATTKRQRKLLILGLERENVGQLLTGKPVYQHLGQVRGLEGWDVTILGPTDTSRFVAGLRDAPTA
jgi:hypothetical protein